MIIAAVLCAIAPDFENRADHQEAAGVENAGFRLLIDQGELFVPFDQLP